MSNDKEKTKYTGGGYRHYEFGKNWGRFIKVLNDERINEAEKSLREYLGLEDFAGKRFLDVGCGSGLFSLCARRMGAEVFSFDYDIDSVNCAKELKRKYFPDDAGWSIEQGDALDRQYMETFRNYDIVYSWGVLHHTGNMRLGFDRIAETVAGSGLLYIAIYNDQGPISKFWRTVKRVYMKTPRILRFLIIVPYVMARAVANLLRHGTPFFGRKQESRGMSQVYDIYDWLGGYPFEVATPDMVIDIFRGKGFELVKLTAQKGKGCNQYVFVKQQAE